MHDLPGQQGGDDNQPHTQDVEKPGGSFQREQRQKLKDLGCKRRIEKPASARERLVQSFPMREVASSLPEDMEVRADALFFCPRRSRRRTNSQD
jgi:hypothetical protein